MSTFLTERERERRLAELDAHQAHVRADSYDTGCALCRPELVRLIEAGAVHVVVGPESVRHDAAPSSTHVPHLAPLADVVEFPTKESGDRQQDQLDLLDAHQAAVFAVRMVAADPVASRLAVRVDRPNDDVAVVTANRHDAAGQSPTGVVHALRLESGRTLAPHQPLSAETVEAIRVRASHGSDIGPDQELVSPAAVAQAVESWIKTINQVR